MIQLNKIIEIDGGTSPYTYQWSTDDSCITFSLATGTTTGTVDTVVYATTETCLTGSTVTLTVTDAIGCVTTLTPVTLTNKCSSLTVAPITKSGTSTFSVTAATAECTTVDIEWVYDTAVYTKLSQSGGAFDSTLTLEYKDGISLPASSPIKARVTDCNNCVETVTYNDAVCIPDPYQLTVYMHYDTVNAQFISSETTFPLPTNCAGYSYTANPTFTLPTGVTSTISSTVTGAPDKIQFTGLASLAGDVINGSYTLTSAAGVGSSSAEVTFIFGTVASAKTINVPDKTWNIDCSDIAGDTVTLNIEDEIVTTAGATIDWSTWQVVMAPSNAATPTLSTDASGDHIISFVLPTPLVNDSFAWVLCDTDGNCSKTVTYTVAECNTPPVAVADAVSTECGLTEEIDVLANDTASDGVIDITSLEIVTYPTYGTVTVIAGGKFSYTTNCNTTGADSFTYRFKDSSGTYSNTETVSLTISCAGVASNVTLCY